MRVCRRIPIIASTKVERDFGTGALKITPGHDPTDYEIGQAASLQIINIMSNDATLNDNAGAYVGIGREEARVRVWDDIKVGPLAWSITLFFFAGRCGCKAACIHDAPALIKAAR